MLRIKRLGPRRGSASSALVVATTLATSTLAIGLGADSAEASLEWPSATTPHPETVSADAMPTVQIDGVVWAQEIVGNTVYVGGEFNNARPAGAEPGQSQTPRSNFLAYDLTTGQLLTSVVLNANAPVRTIERSPDGSRIYVGGNFTSFGGQTRFRIAAVDTADNTVATNFAPSLDYVVYAIGPTADRVYVGGAFSAVGNQARNRLAAFALNGGLLPWAPSVNATVTAVQPSPDGTKVAIGGSFETLNGSTAYRGLAWLDATTGDTRPLPAGSVIRNGGANGGITSLVSGGDLLFGTAYEYGHAAGTIEGRFAINWSDGTVRWIDDCHGDTYSVFPQGDVVYSVGHSHYCGNIGGFPEYDPRAYNRALATTRSIAGTITTERLGYDNWNGYPRPDLLNFFPNINTGTFTGQGQGAWHVTGNERYVVMGGEFTSINGTGQQGLVRFQIRQFAANDQGPRLGSDTYPIRVWSDAAGRVTVNWRANEDRDDPDLTYRVHRRPAGTTGTPTLLHQRIAVAPYWNRPLMTFTDTSPTPGTAYEYRVQVTDGYGNIATSNWVVVNVAASGTRGAYLDSVLASQPDSLWRLDETSGATVNDRVGFRDGTRVGGVAAGAAGVIAGGRASTFSGGTGSFIQTSSFEHPPHEFSLEAWFRAAPGANGGLIVGFNNSNSGAGSSSAQDRHLYMDTAGRIRFGLNAATPQTVASSANYRDNQWHHAIATVGAGGMQLFVDAALVASRTDVSNGRTGYFGYWRIGGGALDGFPSTNTSTGRWFDGALDDIALYKRVLSGGEIAGHYSAAGFDAPNALPTADFSSSVRIPGDGLTIDFDGASSSDFDGTIASWRWTFGDGSPVTTTTTSGITHQFPAIATYSVTLLVTDNEGATHTTTKQVTTVDPATLPGWTDQTIGAMRVDTPVNDGVAATGAPPPTYSIVGGALPTGLDLDPVTGAITGTPTVIGPYSVTIRASNGVGSGINVTLTGVVNSPVDPVLVVDIGVVTGNLPAGSPVTVSGVGLLPGSPVTVALDGVAFGGGTVAEDESLAISTALPDGITTGVHKVTATAAAVSSATVVAEQVFVVDWGGVLGDEPSGAGYQGITPLRVLDTRDGAGKVPAGGEHRLAVNPSWGVPSDAVSVVVNVTATEPEDVGFLTVYPCGTTRPLASALNYMAGQTVPNLVVVPLGALRELCIFSLAQSHVVVDLNGYFAPSAPARIAGSTPVRLVDTRDTTKLAGGQVLEVQVTGDGKAPIGSQSAVINVTVTEPEEPGFVTLYPCDQPLPTASNVNYAAGQTVANQAFVTLSATGTACVFTLAPSHVVLDMNAWFRPGETPELVSLVPVRVLDTRDTVKLAAGETRELPLAGAGGINGATGFAVNTTIVDPEAPGFVTFFPCGQQMPLASSINFTTGQVVANHTTAMVGSNGATCIFASTATHVVVDVEGAYIAFG